MNTPRGFTLVEVLIVVVVLGILATIALPRAINASEAAAESSLKQTLSTVRGAIERFRVDHRGEFPGASDGAEKTFKKDLEPFLIGGRFPVAPLGPVKGTRHVKMSTADVPSKSIANPKFAWRYNYKSGKFTLNCNEFFVGWRDALQRIVTGVVSARSAIQNPVALAERLPDGSLGPASAGFETGLSARLPVPLPTR